MYQRLRGFMDARLYDVERRPLPEGETAPARIAVEFTLATETEEPEVCDVGDGSSGAVGASGFARHVMFLRF